MGLDIHCICNPQYAGPYVSGAEAGENVTRLRPSDDFPTHAGDIVDGWYTYDERNYVTSMSYGTYNVFRSWLAEFAGYPSVESVWKHDLKGSLAELINFSDAEGVICNRLCVKLAADFDKLWLGLPFGGDKDALDNQRRFRTLHHAFRHAANNNGVIKFS